MKLGVAAFTYEPHWNGNRQLPAGERIRMQVEPWTGRDALTDWGPEAVRKWATKELVEARGIEVGMESDQQIAGLRVLMIVCEKTSEYENCEFEDGVHSNPVDVFARLAWGLGEGHGLLDELSTLINGTAGLPGDQVKNFVSEFDGRTIPGTESAASAGTAGGRSDADTPRAKSGPSSSGVPVASTAAQPSN